MTKEERIAILKDNIVKMENSVKNIKCPGVLKKRNRELRNLQTIGHSKAAWVDVAAPVAAE
ncbi:MAG: hypothetical protein J5684_07125 [Eubacterium sp.]|nr:hypothetical protein [Eubacterium sp.]